VTEVVSQTRTGKEVLHNIFSHIFANLGQTSKSRKLAIFRTREGPKRSLFTRKKLSKILFSHVLFSTGTTDIEI
jgi:hypothetical protein